MPGSAVAQVLRLSNGRRLGYAEYGDRRGTPLLFFHATPGSRRVARWADRAARRRGIRLIAPDRPGFGLSDFEPGRTLGAWPADVCETGRCPRDRILCRGRGVARRPLCCRLRLADRGPLTNAGIVSGVGPLDDPALAAALPRGYRAEFALARWAPAAMRPALGLGRLGLRRAPGFVLARVAA